MRSVLMMTVTAGLLALAGAAVVRAGAEPGPGHVVQPKINPILP